MKHLGKCLKTWRDLRKKAEDWIKNGYKRNWATRWLRDFLKTWPVKRLRNYLLRFDYDGLEQDSGIPDRALYAYWLATHVRR